MILIEFHLGLRQVVMALMNWAIDVPQKLLQSDANPPEKFFINTFLTGCSLILSQLIQVFANNYLISELKIKKYY